MRMRRKPNLAARMERNAHLLVKEPAQFRGQWLDTFGYSELRVELGCGKGRFTVETAKNEPDVLFVALEKTASVMVIALERTAAENLRNVRFVNAYADDSTDYFAPGEVSRIYINFCDPWPSNRHAKRRLTGHWFLECYKKILGPGGELHFKTDNFPLFEFSVNEFKLSNLDIVEVVHDLHRNGPVGVMTDYEQRFFDLGMPIFRCSAKVHKAT